MTSFYLTVAIKLALGLISLVFVINLTGKGNLAPSSATDQVQNFVLGAILGGTIYSSTVSILQYIVILIIWTILILLLKWLITNILFIKHLIDGKPTVIIKHGQLDPEAALKTSADVALKLRSQGIFQLKRLNVQLLNRTANCVVQVMKMKYPIVTDGVIQTEILILLVKRRIG
ncbi:MAG: YetF domain-containing protein [Streptococcus sp.]